ncbi:hypothetical protein D3C80_2115560 [compost metagenome]
MKASVRTLDWLVMAVILVVAVMRLKLAAVPSRRHGYIDLKVVAKAVVKKRLTTA